MWFCSNIISSVKPSLRPLCFLSIYWVLCVVKQAFHFSLTTLVYLLESRHQSYCLVQCLLNAQFLNHWLNLIKVHKECSKLCWWRIIDAIVIPCCWLGSFCMDNLNSEVILRGKEFELIIAFKKVVGTLEEFSLGNKTWCLHC